MEAVFLGGSRRVTKISQSVRAKLDELLVRGLWMFVGDANGADRALQTYLANKGYERVVVYSVTGMLRNNIGHWRVQYVDAPAGARGFALYSVKDVRMAHDASYGLMLWDGKSRGTLENVRNLLSDGKPVAVHLGPSRRLVSLGSPADLHKLGVASEKRTGAQPELFSVTGGQSASSDVGSPMNDEPVFARPPTLTPPRPLPRLALSAAPAPPRRPPHTHRRPPSCD